MILKELDLQDGRITHDGLRMISSDVALMEQVDDLDEDLLQVEYPNGFLLDIGWYPSFNPDGEFLISVIRNYDWEAPIYASRAKSFIELKKAVQTAVLAIKVGNV